MQKLLEFGWQDIIRGEGPSDYIPSAGFSPFNSYALNLTKSRGRVYFMATETDLGGATLTDDAIAFAIDQTLAGNDCYIMDDGGAFYTLAADNTLTKRQTITADTFARGTSDLLQFALSASSVATLATGNSSIIKFTGSNLNAAAPETDFWTGLSTGVRHPLERVEDQIFIGDGNLIHAYNGTTTTSAWVTLPPDVNITSLRKHPDGRTLLAFCGISKNFSHIRPGGGRVYYVDAVLRDWTREIDVDSQVEGTQVVGGTVYVTYGDNLGYFDGNGLVFLKKITPGSTETASGNATYSQNLTNIEGILVVRDDVYALAYGDLGAGRAFWKLYQTLGSRTITAMFYRGDNKMLFAYQQADGTEKLVQIDMDNAGANGSLTSNHYFFPAEAQIKRIEILHGLMGGTERVVYSYRKHSGGVTQTIEDITYTTRLTNKTRINCDIKTDAFQLYMVPQSGQPNIIAVRVYGDLLP